MNLKQLSDMLGLSPTTVSRALNGYPEVNARTRARVIEAARHHGYVPNSMAKRLATGRAMAIGHVVPLSDHDMINPIFADFIAGAGRAYSEAGYNMILSVVPAEEEEASYRALSAAHSVDGIIVHGPKRNDYRIPLLNELGIRFMVHGRCDSTHPHAWLDMNNRAAFLRATEYLIGLGHRRIALLNGIETLFFAIRRRAGYEDALRAAGIAPDPALVFNSDMTEPYGYRTARALLAGPNPPTAFLSSSLITALGISRAIADAGLRLGADVSVITHDDALLFLPNQGERPMFTSTKSSIRDAGYRMGQLLIDIIEGRADPHVTELWEAELVIGSSTGPAPSG
ncbi:LacI family DNA-binding transcriptional regulator [Halovulum dunhuangense]|uniref:LacI family DNA-binding transcriptional regulator n=1 Tax=Halovulum dunhuangense TaxID=1505036 RepID=A0A849KPJ5_9RHOB|nr:substrate-binding domain-containing protein [Halovulum dunhuangense]NNU78973.1 LacI family DNA-binding transcriptional regulator [Halovulum dunhuangense]